MTNENSATEPFIVISRWRVKEGKHERLGHFAKKIATIVETNEPQIIGFNYFLNEDGTELTVIQIHPDTASMDFHMQVLKENWDESFSEYSQIVEGNISVEYYGTPPASALELDFMNKWVTNLNPLHVAGFVRTAA